MLDTAIRTLIFALLLGLVFLGLMDILTLFFKIQMFDFIVTYRSEIISLGTLYLVTCVAMFTAHISNRSAEKREKYSRKVESELKLADFRQAWIDAMRDDLTKCGELLFDKDNKEKHPELVALRLKIRMRLNLKEPLALKLFEAINNVPSAQKTASNEKEGEALVQFGDASYNYLKNEWERLKDDIRNARLLE